MNLCVTREFDFPAEAVFDAWVDPTAVGRWLFRTPTGVLVRAGCDPRVGGGFVVIERRGDATVEHVGTYVELARPTRVVFDFAAGGAATPTRVTVAIDPLGPSRCRVTLSHDLAAEWAAHADRARGGWTLILNNLAATLAATGMTP
jgi:uncharacterized protein YndB with AHSA1/START domain